MSSEAVTVQCEHASTCPGCPLIELSYGEQLAKKTERVAGATERFLELGTAKVLATEAADPITGYRTRAKLVVDGTRIGLYERSSHAVIDIPGCRVIDPGILKIVDRIRRALPLHRALVAIDVRRVEDRFLVTFVVESGAEVGELEAFAKRLATDEPRLAGVALSRRERGSAQVLGQSPTTIIGASRLERRTFPGGAFHYATHGAFVQAHADGARSLTQTILSALRTRLGRLEGLSVLELFGGSGALSLDLAKAGAELVSVEAFEPAAAQLREAARAQSLDVTVEAADATRATRSFADAARRFDVVIVNPPRRGLSPALRIDLARLSPTLLVYVSCEPATLARDLADLSRRGYAADELRPFDMMPLTREIETVAVLAPSRVPLPEVLFADAELIAVNKAPHEPTTPQGEHESSLLDRVRRLPDAALAVPVHRLDGGTSGVCLFARRPEFVPQLAAALTDGEKEYVALVRGIARKKGSIAKPLFERGEPHLARTRYSRGDVVSGHSLLRVRPDQGRKHQIRRHLASIGHPLIGDPRYGDPRTNLHFSLQHGLDRPFLHCGAIRLERRDGPLELVAPLAPDLDLVLESLANVASAEPASVRAPDVTVSEASTPDP